MAFARDLMKFSRLTNVNEFTKLSTLGSLNNFPFIASVRSKHYNPKFKWLRGKKVVEQILPDSEKYKEYQSYLLKSMKIFPRYWKRRMITITSTSEFFEPYQPPEGDGKVTKLSKTGALEKIKNPKNFVADKTALRKIKNYDYKFEVPIFLQEAHDLYIKAHTTLMKLDEDELSKYVTEKALEEMMEGLKLTTIHWQFIESLEPPKLVQSRVEQLVVEKNLFAQLTVRFHTKQKLAIYDRFGRLMHGSEILAKDVLEYVVFEKHISNEYGVWKLHGKIIPEWKQSPPSYLRTYRVEKEVEEEDEFEDFMNEDYAVPEQETVNKETAEIVKAESKASN